MGYSERTQDEMDAGARASAEAELFIARERRQKKIEEYHRCGKVTMRWLDQRGYVKVGLCEFSEPFSIFPSEELLARVHIAFEYDPEISND